jgi:hypothetical protein
MFLRGCKDPTQLMYGAPSVKSVPCRAPFPFAQRSEDIPDAVVHHIDAASGTP